MKTVEQVLVVVYGDIGTARDELGVTRTAPCNWQSRGGFPLAQALKVLADARRKRIAIQLSDIPMEKSVRATLQQVSA